MVSMIINQILNVIMAAACVSNLAGGTGDWSAAGSWSSCGGGTPGAGDTARIVSGDTITLDSSQTIGTGVASISTCELDIEGTLQVSKSPGANIVLTAQGTVCVNSGAEFNVADDATTNYLDCNYYFELNFDTSSSKYYLNSESGGVVDWYGCVGYGNSSGTVQRARIASCSPDCDAGAITITLDRTVAWQASASVYRPSVVIGVGGHPTIDPGANDAEEIASWTSPATNQIALTTTQDHEVGDIVLMSARNVIVTSSNTANHSRVYVQSDGALDWSWVRVHEMGYDITNGSAVGNSGSGIDNGDFDFVAFTNIGFNTTTAVTAVLGRQGMSTFTDVSVWLNDPGTTSRCFDFQVNAIPGIDPFYMTDATCIGGNAKGYCFYSAETAEVKVHIDGLWCSDQYGHNTYLSGFQTLENSLLHKSVYAGIVYSHQEDSEFGALVTIDNNEFYWSTSTYCMVLQNPMNLIFKNNTISSCEKSCLFVRSLYGTVRMYNNSYDACNLSDTLLEGGVMLNESGSNYNIAGELYMQNEDFGSVSANYRKNIVIISATNNTNLKGGPMKLVCNNCKYGTPNNEYGTYGIQFDQYATLYTDLTLKEGSHFALHNKNQVAGEHETFVGNARVQRETTINCSSGSNLKMKITPFHAVFYGNIPIAKVHVENGETVTVTVDLRKDEAMATNGTRPRLALDGAGFELDSDNDEMSDVTDTWETVTVTGTATYDGMIRVYLQVKNKLAGGDVYTPVWTPTLDIYADCLDVTVSN